MRGWDRHPASPFFVFVRQHNEKDVVSSRMICMPLKPAATVSGGLPSKPAVTVFFSLTSKLVVTVYLCLASKPVVSFLVESQNQGGGGFFGLGIKTGGYGLVI
jgi:hypothetical protein